MKRDPALVQLSHDHLSALVLVYCLKRGRGSSDRYQWPTEPREQIIRIQQVWQQELQPHFFAEEQFIFLPVQEAPVSSATQDLTQELLAEHRHIEALIESLPGLFNEALDTALHELSEILEAHIRKEERRYFEALQAELSAERLAQIGQKITTYYSELPAFVCALTGLTRQLGD